AALTLANNVTVASGQSGTIKAPTASGAVTTLSGNYSGVAGTLTLDASGGTGFSGIAINSAIGPAIGSVTNLIGTTNANNVQLGLGSATAQNFFANTKLTVSASGAGQTLIALGNGGSGHNVQFGALDGGNSTTTISSDNASSTVTINGVTAGNFAGVIADGANGGFTPLIALVKTGSATQTLSGINTYTGTTTVSGGTLSISGSINNSAIINVGGGNLSTTGADKLANAAAVTVSGGTLTVGGADSVGSLAMSSGTIGGSNTLTAATYNLSGGTVTGNLGAGTLNSSGTVALNGTSGAGVVNVSAGTLTLGSSDRLNNSAAVTVSGGALALGANNHTVGTVVLAGGSITGSGGTLLGSSYDMRSGSVSAKLGGAVALTKTTGGTVTLTGANTYTGATTISAGTLALGAGGSISDSSGVSLGTSGTFDVAATGGYSVNNLSGSGIVVGSLTVSTQLAIGNSPGTTNFESLNLGSASTYLYELTGGASTADLGNVSAVLTLSSGATLDLVQLGTYTADDKFTLFGYNSADNLSGIGTFAGYADDSTFTDAGGIWQINYDDTLAGLNGGTGDRFVTITAVPEPAAALLGGLGLLALLRRRRNS
ncbi:MAG TPA: autotransporter-associated beta strand repeat-containing protein, partial [Luteolibacter sp.]